MFNLIRCQCHEQTVIPGVVLGSTMGESWRSNGRHCPVLGDAGLPLLLLKLAYWAINALSVLEMLIHFILGKYVSYLFQR